MDEKIRKKIEEMRKAEVRGTIILFVEDSKE